MGEWHFPGGTMVPRRTSATPFDNFTRSGFSQQVRLSRINDVVMPSGVYECRVPSGNNGSVMHVASITLIGVLFVNNDVIFKGHLEQNKNFEVLVSN